MTNEEINVLINLHIEELEKNIQPTEVQRARLIKALKEAGDRLADKSN